MRGGPARCTLGAKAWITAGSATAQWKARSARRYPPPPKRLRSSKSNPGLTNGSGQNIIVEIRGSRRRVADIKSESRPASNRNWWPASYWNAWPASSESAPSGAVRRRFGARALGSVGDRRKLQKRAWSVSRSDRDIDRQVQLDQARLQQRHGQVIAQFNPGVGIAWRSSELLEDNLAGLPKRRPCAA